MAEVTKQIFEQYRQLTQLTFPDNQTLLDQVRNNDGYWEQRRQQTASIIGNTALSQEEIVENLLVAESLAPMLHHNIRLEMIKSLAINAVLADESLTGAERFEYLAEIETGKYSQGGFSGHKGAIEFLLKSTAEKAPDGLLLKLDYTDKDASKGYGRKLINAKPYKVDVQNLGYFKFDLNDESPENDHLNLTDDEQDYALSSESGLYFRYTNDVSKWRAEKDMCRNTGFKVYGIYTSAEDKVDWIPYGGFSWSGSEYPDYGAQVLRGQEQITDFISKMMSFGGVKLNAIKEDVADYPGFEFIHDIQATGNPGADKSDMELNQE